MEATERVSLNRVHLTLQEFVKTQECQELLKTAEPFAIEGHLFQGFEGKIAVCDVDQFAGVEEIKRRVTDVDGQSLTKILKRVKEVEDARVYSREQEFAKRIAARASQRMAELQIIKLEQELGLRNATEATEAAVVVSDEHDTAADTDRGTAPTVEMAMCEICGESFPKRSLQGHKMGKHRVGRESVDVRGSAG